MGVRFGGGGVKTQLLLAEGHLQPDLDAGGVQGEGFLSGGKGLHEAAVVGVDARNQPV